LSIELLWRGWFVDNNIDDDDDTRRLR